MIGVVCQCGRIKDFPVIDGVTYERCGCGSFRHMRRTVDEIAAQEAAYEQQLADEWTPRIGRACTSPAGTEGCTGKTTSARAEYCVPCAEARIRERNRGYHKTRKAKQRRARAA